NRFDPHIGRAAVALLESAGFDVVIPDAAVCCGLTWISTGQLSVAQKVFGNTLNVLRPWLEAGTPIIGLEPSCTAVFRADMPEMLPDDKLVERLAGQTRTLAEFLLEQAPDGWEPPQVRHRALVQTHCHQHAVMGFDADLELLRRALRVRTVPLRRLDGARREGAAAGGARLGSGHLDHRGRVQLPHPDRAGRYPAEGHPPGRGAGARPR